MKHPNNDNVVANDGEWNQHRNKWMKRITSKLRRRNAKKKIEKELEDE